MHLQTPPLRINEKAPDAMHRSQLVAVGGESEVPAAALLYNGNALLYNGSYILFTHD
jgi:hypothetical protein